MLSCSCRCLVVLCARYTKLILSFTLLVLLNRSLQIGKAGRVTVGTYFQVSNSWIFIFLFYTQAIFTVILSTIFLEEKLYWTTLVGGILIALNAAIATYKGWREILRPFIDRSSATEMRALSETVNSDLGSYVAPTEVSVPDLAEQPFPRLASSQSIPEEPDITNENA